MSTGLVDTWANVDKFGPIYPFVGTEGLLVIAGLAFWIVWHIWQLKSESAEFKSDMEKIKERGGIGKFLDDEK
jgi:hypothetical protein